MLKKEYEILEAFIEKPWKKFTFKGIKELSGKKSDSYVYDSLNKFAKEKILGKEKIGNSIVYFFNLNSAKTQIYAGFVAEYIGWNKKYIPYEDLQKIMLKIPTDFFIFVITGSYASKKQKTTSDIDVVIICDDSIEPKRIYAELKHECEMNIPKIHLYVFTKSEFLNMLLEEKANYGKEIANKNFILFGGEEYYKILAEAIKNGFNG